MMHNTAGTAIPGMETGRRKWWKSTSFIVVIYSLLTVVLYIQLVLTGKYNNFVIFRTSLRHLTEGMPLYNLYPAEYFDYYLYHPSFPVLFAPFAIFPQEVGLLLWLLFSTAIFLYAVQKLPIRNNVRILLYFFLLVELFNAIQSSQTNPAMTAFMLLTVVHLDKEQPGRAAFFTCLSFFIKGYGAVIGLLFLFYPKKWQYLGYCALYGVIGTLLPLLFVSPATLVDYYVAWFDLLTSSTIKEDGSLLGSIHEIWHLPEQVKPLLDKVMIGIGVVGLAAVFVMGLIRRQAHTPWLVAAYLLIWIVVFNQSTESPTYIMAVTGAGIGLLCFAPTTPWTKTLLVATLVITSLCPTDLVPKFLNEIAVRYRVKAIPCFAVLLYLQWLICIKINRSQ